MICIFQDSSIPILTIRLELIDKIVAFRPPLDQNTSDVSVQETVDKWLECFLSRGSLVRMLGGKGSYHEYIQMDEEVQQLVEHINKLVKDNSEECKVRTSLHFILTSHCLLLDYVYVTCYRHSTTSSVTSLSCGSTTSTKPSTTS